MNGISYKKALRMTNRSVLGASDLLTWQLIEAEKTGSPIERFIATQVLGTDTRREIYRVIDERFDGGDDEPR